MVRCREVVKRDGSGDGQQFHTALAIAGALYLGAVLDPASRFNKT